ncbi:MAG TPA: kelch repeat-containing protein, partial [Archangium sp.]|nr:kelch repeat-containing protein [Archangium sp.]
GTTPLSSVELYGAAAGDLSWNYTQNLNWAHSDHAAVAITTTPSGGGSVQKVLVFGGASFVGSYEWLEILDLSSNSLSAVTIGYNQPTTYSLGDGCTATVLNTGKVFVVSARISLIYDPVSQTVAQTTINRYTVSHGYNHTATLLRDGKVLVAGGQSLGTGINALSAVELFDPGPKDSTTVARLSVGRANATATLLPSATTTTPDKVLVTGGFDETTVLASAELYDTASKTWSPAPRMTIPRALHTATRFESGPLAGKVLVVGGRDASGVPDASAELYDPVHGSWRLTGAMTFKRERHTATLLPSGLVLVLGGRDENQSALDSVEVYDPATERWSMSMPSLRTARHGHSATLLASGAVLVSGGLNGGTRLSVMELYSPVPRRWRYLSLPAGQSFHLSESTNTGEIVGNPSVTLLADGSVLCAGGLDKAQSLPGNLSQSQARSSVVTFNPATQTWKSAEMGPLITARGGHTATLLPSGKVLMVGGAVLTETNKGVFPTEKVEVYDPVARKSVSVQGFSLGTARWAHTATLLASGKVLVVGGRTRHYYDRFSDVFLDNVDVYDPVTRSWSSVGTLPFALAHHAAVLLADGKVLVTGGIGARLGTGSKTALLFDPNKPYDPRNPSAAWSATLAPMKGTHYRHTATRFESGPLAGKVLVAGGGASPPELYDPNATDPTKVWTFTGAMATNRSDHFAHLLPDGKVLVVGGTADLSEVYNPASGTWSTMGSVGLGFSGRGSALLPSGGVFALWEGFAAAYLPLVGTWTSTNSPSMTHEQPVAALLGQGQVLLVGQNKAELYDPVTERWEEAGSMKTNLPPDSITPLKDGGVLVIKRGAAELYDPANPQAPWSTVDAGMVNKVRRGHTATLLPSGGVLVVGGSSPNNNGIEDFTYTVELYQPGQGWSSKKSMTGVLSNPPSNHSATFLPDVGLEGSVLVLGQWGVAGLYDVAGDSWKAISTLPVLGGRHTVTRFESGPLAGKLLVVGSFSNAELKAVIFDPKATVEPWRSTKHSPAYKHSHHSATLLPSGKVLIVGAKIESTLPAVVDTAQAEVFDPVTETWALGGRMGTPRFDHTATLLPSGKVLVLEGLTPVMREGTTMGTLQPVLVSVNTAELYDELGTQDTWHPGASLPG